MGWIEDWLTYKWITRTRISDSINEGISDVASNIADKVSEMNRQANIDEAILNNVGIVRRALEFDNDSLTALGIEHKVYNITAFQNGCDSSVKVHFYGKPENGHKQIEFIVTAYDDKRPIHKETFHMYADAEFYEMYISLYGLKDFPAKIAVNVNPPIVLTKAPEEIPDKTKEAEAQNEGVEGISIKKILSLFTDIIRYIVGAVFIYMGIGLTEKFHFLVTLALILLGLSLFPAFYRIKGHEQTIKRQVERVRKSL